MEIIQLVWKCTYL